SGWPPAWPSCCQPNSKQTQPQVTVSGKTPKIRCTRLLAKSCCTAGTPGSASAKSASSIRPLDLPQHYSHSLLPLLASNSILPPLPVISSQPPVFQLLGITSCKLFAFRRSPTILRISPSSNFPTHRSSRAKRKSKSLPPALILTSKTYRAKCPPPRFLALPVETSLAWWSTARLISSTPRSGAAAVTLVSSGTAVTPNFSLSPLEPFPPKTSQSLFRTSCLCWRQFYHRLC